MTHQAAASNSPRRTNAGTIRLQPMITIFILGMFASFSVSAPERSAWGQSAAEAVDNARLESLALSARPSLRTSALSPQKAERIKLAEGEFAVYQRESGGAVGPFDTAVFNFHESWTLWRTGDSGYQVQGERRFESPKDVPYGNRFEVLLSQELRVTSVKEFARLRWRLDSGPLTCDFSTHELHCSSNAKDPQQAVEV